MPLTDELDAACREVLPADTPGPPLESSGGSFELWLSQLADDQPYLNAQTNLRNRATFVAYSSAIAEVLEQRTDLVLRQRWPRWLPAFVKAAHQTRAGLVTFNYDTLIECAVDTGLLYDWGASGAVCWTELTDDVPNWPSGSARWAADRAETFQLMKLHGSLNWYWSPGDQTGVSVARRQLPGKFGASRPYTERDRRRDLPGRVPFIVPPAAAKSSYYQNPITREMWFKAASRLSLPATDRIVLIGYSLPLTDLTFGSMFRETAAARHARITVVDRSPEPIIDRLHGMGFARDAVTAVGGESCVADFVTGWIKELGRDAAVRLRADGHVNEPMFVCWGPEQTATVIGQEIRGREVILRIGPIGRSGLLGRHAHAAGDLIENLPRVVDLPPMDGHLFVELGDRSRQTVIGHGEASFQTGHGAWNVLYTSGSTPSALGAAV